MNDLNSSNPDDCSLGRDLVLVAGVPFDNLGMDQVTTRIEYFIESGRPHYVATANVNFVVTANRDPEFMEVVRMADLITPDGMPVVWASELLGTPLKERVTGVDLVYRLAGLAAEKGYRLFFLGGNPGVGEKAVNNLKAMHPGLKASFFSPDFDPLLEMKNNELLYMIKDYAPDVLFVSLGAGKAEKWMRMNIQNLEVPVSMGVGAAVDFISGRRKRAPLWMRERGMEWIHRMFQEPWRLGKRYTRDFFFFNYYIRRQLYMQKWRNLAALRKHGPELSGISGYPGRTKVIKVTGRLDYNNASELAARALKMLQKGNVLALDLSKVRFMDSSGLGALAGLEKHARGSGSSLVLHRPTPEVLQILKHARMKDFFRLTDGRSATGNGAPGPGGPVIGSKMSPGSGILDVVLAGRLDADVSQKLINSLFELVWRDDFAKVRLNMEKVTFIDSTGLSVLIALHKRLTSEGRTLAVANLAGDAGRVFKIMRMDRYLETA